MAVMTPEQRVAHLARVAPTPWRVGVDGETILDARGEWVAVLDVHRERPDVDVRVIASVIVSAVNACMSVGLPGRG